jgi:hypothetical protein
VRAVFRSLPDASLAHFPGCQVPSIDFHLLPRLGAEFDGTWRLWCNATGLAAEISHAPRLLGVLGRPQAVRGRLLRFAPPWSAADAAAPSPPRLLAVLATVEGTLDGSIVATPAPGAAAAAAAALPLGGVVWDAAAAAAAEAAAPRAAALDAGEPLASEAVWGTAARALAAAHWDVARAHKHAVDGAAAAARAAREAGRAPPHVPHFFVRDAQEGWRPCA